MLAVRTGIAPRMLWEADPADLATMLDVLQEPAPGRRGARRG